MKIVIAPDSFKESMSALSAASAIDRGIRRVIPTCQTIKVPMADGGEGMVRTLVASLNGEVIETFVTGPLGEKVRASYGIIDEKIAVIEVAAAVGLNLLEVNERDPMNTTTYGVGELILHALEKGIRKFVIGLGGSSTNDGGIGMAQALGAAVTDEGGRPVPYGGRGLSMVHNISTLQMDERLKECTFEIACDVKNPLTGPQGATYIYGPQKGADPDTIPVLEKAMKKYGNIIKRDLQIDVIDREGAGAAGGLGAACLAFLNGTLKRGIDLIIEMTNIEHYIKNADLVITGEGKIDDQTLYGKTPIGIAKIAKKYHVPVIAITGVNKVNINDIYESGITAVFSITNEPISMEEAMEKSESLTEKVTENIMRIIMLKNNDKGVK